MKRRISAVLMLLILLVTIIPAGMAVSAAGIADHVTVTSYDDKKDYMKEIMKCLQNGSDYAMQIGGIYEQQRNLKIEKTGAKQKKTNYFTTYSSATAILEAIAEDNKPAYSQEDLYWLSRVIQAEAGSSWIPDWVQRGVGSVVLNRVKSSRFANSVKGVVFQVGQYYCVTSGSIYNSPSQKAIDNAKYLLEKGSTLPDGVLGQSEHIQGTIHSQYYDPYLRTTTYFCYM